MEKAKYGEIAVTLPDGPLAWVDLMHIMEDAATYHCSLIGASNEQLEKKYNALWMLARCQLILSHPISGPCRFRCVTNHRDFDGVLVYRDFDFYVEDEHIGEASQAWIVAAKEDHHILRPSLVKEYEGWAPDNIRSGRLNKLKPQVELHPLADYTVTEEDIDFNHHMNNCRYVAAAEKLLGHRAKWIKMGFLKECHLGDTLHFLVGDTDFGWFVRAVDDEGKPCFDAEFGQADH